MQVFKFGGASMRDAASIVGLLGLLKGYEKAGLLVVVSALGKTTRALEEVCQAYYEQKPNAVALLAQIRHQHQNLVKQLFLGWQAALLDDIHHIFTELFLRLEEPVNTDFDFIYDQIVPAGELLSSKIISAYLNAQGLSNQWIDARSLLQTDHTYRSAKIDELLSEQLTKEQLLPLLAKQIVVTQGFIGGTSEKFSTTLGKEGSDYSAAVFANFLDADTLTLWKDVPGLFNADPNWLPEAKLIEQISYKDARKLIGIGASVIHPASIFPAEKKQIPLYVRSFVQPNRLGTCIREQAPILLLPAYLRSKNGVLYRLTQKEKALERATCAAGLCSLLAKYQVKAPFLHADSNGFWLWFASQEEGDQIFLTALQASFHIADQQAADLVRIWNYEAEALDTLPKDQAILLLARQEDYVYVLLTPANSNENQIMEISRTE